MFGLTAASSSTSGARGPVNAIDLMHFVICSSCCNETWATVTLSAGFMHDLIVEYMELRCADLSRLDVFVSDEPCYFSGVATMELSWSSPSTAKQIIPSSALYATADIQGSPFKNITFGSGDPPSQVYSFVRFNHQLLCTSFNRDRKLVSVARRVARKLELPTPSRSRRGISLTTRRRVRARVASHSPTLAAHHLSPTLAAENGQRKSRSVIGQFSLTS